MPTPQHADRIRALAYSNFIEPGLSEGAVVRVRAGDVHDAMQFKDRVPLVVAALKAQKFTDQYGLRLLSIDGPSVSTTTTFTFAAAEDESAAGRGPALTEGHKDALEWFAQNARTTVPWEALNSGALLKAIIPKGIYRPKNWRHALSIKIIPGGPYPDRFPETWQSGMEFRYHQEEVRGAAPATENSNLGLANCMRDRVPVGIIRRVTPKPNVTYEVVGVGQVLEWRDGFFSIRILDSMATPLADVFGTDLPPPISEEDARRRVARSIVARLGQPKFRSELFAAYGGRCAISGCNVRAVLEAAHIRPYLGTHTNSVSNGLLLRADLHTLFDLGLLKIEPTSRKVVLAEALEKSEYGRFNHTIIRQPVLAQDAPTADNLNYAWTRPVVGPIDANGD
jgi:putative restriction endonuclease